jgi:hypothetical protein
MNKGYEVVDKIRIDYSVHKENSGSRKDDWHKWTLDWIDYTLGKLNETYIEKSRQYNFREAKTTRYATSGDLLYTGLENAIEVKVQILKGYYDFIMRQSYPSITINGNLNFQVGENNTNDQSK